MNGEPSTVDLVVCARHVITVDGADRVIRDGAVAVRNGRIIAVGSAIEVLAHHSPLRHIDAPFGILLPGFVNTHAHLAMTLFRGAADDLSLEAFLGRLIPLESRSLTPDRVAAGTKLGALEAVLAGTTTVLDMYFYPEDVRRAAEDVGIRLLTGPVFIDTEGPDGMGFDDRLRSATTLLDSRSIGSTDDDIAVLSPHSLYALDPARVRAVAELGAEYGAVVQIHAAETATEVATVIKRHGQRPVHLLAELGVLDLVRTVIAHGVHLDDNEISLLADHPAVTVAHCPGSNLKLASGIAPIARLRDAGVAVTLGTDGPASSNDLDPWRIMRLAAILHGLRATDALRIATLGGAAALGLDHATGSIELGKWADLVIVDGDQPHFTPLIDPIAGLVHAAGRADVSDVFVRGRHIVESGISTMIDTRATMDDVTCYASEIMKHA